MNIMVRNHKLNNFMVCYKRSSRSIMPYLSAKNHLQISVNVMKLILRVSLLQATKYADNHSILLSYVGEKS